MSDLMSDLVWCVFVAVSFFSAIIFMPHDRYNQLRHKATDEDMAAVDAMLSMMQVCQ